MAAGARRPRYRHIGAFKLTLHSWAVLPGRRRGLFLRGRRKKAILGSTLAICAHCAAIAYLERRQ